MVKLTPTVSKTRGRISTQTKTSQRVGRLRQQRRRTTVKVRKRLKKQNKSQRGFWLW